MVTDSGSTYNLVSIEMVENLGLERMKHPTCYKLSWLQKWHQVLVNEKCNVEFKIGTYTFVVVCDIIPIDVFHILLGRPWKYDRKFGHDGRKNTYSLEKDGKWNTLSPLEDKAVQEGSGSNIFWWIGKNYYKKSRRRMSYYN